LSSAFAIDGRAGPIVRPGNIPVFPKSNHGLNSESHAWLAFADGLILRIMGHVRRAVEQFTNPMPAISSNGAAALAFRVLLDDIAKLSYQRSRFDCLNRLVQALTCCLDNTYIVCVGFRLVANVVCLVQISMETFVVKGDVDVQYIAVEQGSLVGDTMADDLVDRSTARFRKAIVVQRRRIRLSRHWSM
jgi:hypothetical protein